MLFSLATIIAIAVNYQIGTMIRVAVGKSGSLRYTPNNITTEVGTTIEFNFFLNVSSQIKDLLTRLKKFAESFYCSVLLCQSLSSSHKWLFL